MVVILRRRCPILSIPLSNHDPSKQTIHSYRFYCKMVVILKRTNSFYRPVVILRRVTILSILQRRYPFLSIPLSGEDVRAYRPFEEDVRSDRFRQMLLILRRRYSVSIPSIGSDSWMKAIRSYQSRCKWSRFLEE
ncbi:8355_t:CDS:2, partial [Funneliformis geosporum]